MTCDDLRRRADAVRHTPLEAVLPSWGASRDRYDKAKWHTDQGPLSVTGQQFINWQRHSGGGGAIDLVMHLGDLDILAAVAWLEDHFHRFSAPARGSTDFNGLCQTRLGNTQTHQRSGKTSPAGHTAPAPLCLPARDNTKLNRVCRYLVHQRRLEASLVEPLIESGKLYADRRGNAVFLLLGKAQQPVGAELRGTGARVWRGMAPGTQKNAGYFWIGPTDAKAIVLCESAIDSISCFALFPDRMCISTSGVRSHPGWLSCLIDQGYDISCGFDRDAAGEAMAAEMHRLFPKVQRLRPPAHDWNDALPSNRTDTR